MPNVATVSAKFVADVENMLRDLKRADNATRQTASSIDREVEQLSKNLKRKFSLSDVGKDVLKGFGIGSGFGVAEQAFSKWVEILSEADRNAQAVAEHLKEVRQVAEEIAKIRFDNFLSSLSPKSQLDTLQSALNQLDAKIASAQRRKDELYGDLAKAGSAPFGTIAGTAFDPLSGKYGYGTMRGVGDKIDAAITENAKEQDKLTKERLALTKQIQETQKKIAEEEKKAGEFDEKDRERRIRALTEGLRQQEEAFDALIKKQHDANEESSKARKEAEQLAEKYRELADPTLRFTKQIEDVNKLLADGKLNAEQAARAIAELKREMADDKERRINKALDDFFGDMDKRSAELGKVKDAADEFEQHMSHMWQSVSDRAGQAFADVLITGKGAFSDLVDIVARSVVEIAAQLLIINPILNGIFGGMPGFSALPAAFSFGGGKARGGSVEPGFTYMVNENRQEFFRPSVGGEVMPIGPSRTREGGGDTFHFNYSFATGITKSELMPLLALQQRDTIAKIADAKRRRTAVGAAL